MCKYKKVVLDLETTGLDADCNEILQVSAIDQDGNTLINEYCKPKFLTEWHEAEQIHGITPEMVKDKKPFEYYIEKLSEILTKAEQIIIYNAEFELSFLEKYKVEFNTNIYDLITVWNGNKLVGNYTISIENIYVVDIIKKSLLYFFLFLLFALLLQVFNLIFAEILICLSFSYVICSIANVIKLTINR